MSLRHGLLGLLAEGPHSGYDLARRFREAPFGPVWPAQHPKIYGELGRLESEGLIEIASHGPRRRKAYRITEAGLAEIRRWLAADEVDHTLRLEPLLRSFFFWLMSPDDLRRHLDREASFYALNARTLRDFAERKDRGEFGDSAQVQSLRIALEGAIGLYETLATWASWAGDRVAAGDHPAPIDDPPQPA
jgi:DNA-binding PadR family transcriptional regulator